MEDIKNTWAIILGGSSGLGLASAQRLAEIGFHICIVHRTRRGDVPALENEVETMKNRGVQVLTFNKDALQNETIEEVLTAIPDGRVQVLLHSIAKGSLNELTQMSLADFQITNHAMALSWWQWTQALMANNKFTKSPKNLAFTSEGNQKVWKGYGAVSVAKACLEALMRQMAVEYASFGMTTNCIQAGATRTPSFDMIPGSDHLATMAAKRNPFQTLTTPEKVAELVGLLCQEASHWINGSIIKVDGGESLR